MNLKKTDLTKGQKLMASLRERAGLSYRALAKKVGCSPGYLHMIESGAFETPAADFLFKVAESLNTNTDSFCNIFHRLPPDLEVYVTENAKEVTKILRRKIKREEKKGLKE